MASSSHCLLLLLSLSLFVSSSSISVPRHLDRAVEEDGGRVLSRHRRLAVASTTGWILAATFAVTAPNQDGGSITVSVPFRYFPDTQLWFASLALSSPITRSGVSGTYALRLSFDTNGLSGRKRRRRRSVVAPLPFNSTRSGPRPPCSDSVPRREADRLMLIQMVEDWSKALGDAKCLENTEQYLRRPSVDASDGVMLGADGNNNVTVSSDAAGFDSHACMLRLLCEVAATPSSEDLLGEALKLLLAPAELQKAAAAAPSADPLLGSDYLRAQADGAVVGDCSKYAAKCPRPLSETFLQDDRHSFNSAVLNSASSSAI